MQYRPLSRGASLSYGVGPGIGWRSGQSGVGYLCPQLLLERCRFSVRLPNHLRSLSRTSSRAFCQANGFRDGPFLANSWSLHVAKPAAASSLSRVATCSTGCVSGHRGGTTLATIGGLPSAFPRGGLVLTNVSLLPPNLSVNTDASLAALARRPLDAVRAWFVRRRPGAPWRLRPGPARNAA